MDIVKDYFQNVHHVILCLFVTLGFMPFAIQVSNLSPHLLHNGREIVLEDHDQGINLCACPFTRTCWVMFLAFPLDFQIKEYLS